MRGAPCRTQPMEGTFQSSDHEHLLSIIEFFVSDAAGDEQKAGKLLRDGFRHLQPALPSLKVVVRDRAHASRRIISRGWSADPYLKSVLDMLLHNRMSIVRIIENSVVWKARFQELIAREPSPPVVTNRTRGLDYAPHRFDSKAKPLARCCCFFSPAPRDRCYNHGGQGQNDVGIHRSQAVSAICR